MEKGNEKQARKLFVANAERNILRNRITLAKNIIDSNINLSKELENSTINGQQAGLASLSPILKTTVEKVEIQTELMNMGIIGGSYDDIFQKY